MEELHGTRVSDPYRWLEDPDSPETADFVDQQDLRYKRYIASSPHRDHLYSEITKMFDCTRRRAAHIARERAP